MNDTLCDLDSIIQLSKDSETLGFDLSTGPTWIYPTNYQVRDYQFNITQAALHNNTLVSLPTGLGKTFIAAVIMYNFYRWYPMGKIIFMAPTRPLVKQQQDACYNIMAIPPNATAEMTGNKDKASRVKIWKDKRVFFITPQILQNDIDVVLDLAQQIKCIVIDEAHRALGKHANCEAIKKIHKINKYFRILALSATPGSNFNSVKDVITNLLISHIEVRSNESKDVAPYVFNRKLETFVIPITGELLAVKNKYIMILDKYTRPLLQYNIFSGNCANLTKGRIVLVMKEFKERGRNHAKYSSILKSLSLCITLYHGYELLIRHGLRGFLVFFEGTISKPLINSINELHGILNDVRNYLGPLEEIEMLPDGTVPEVEGPVVYSHPKFKRLNDILIEHFKAIEDSDTRVMVFCEYRESVMEIYQMLLRLRPLVKPRVFLGQGAISQAKQIQAVKQFKSGTCNTLISTCIGEEGLDVGEVDLIVCFDISSKSPIRMVQRMGRTGRKRDGRVVVLVTEGKEQQLLSECLVQKNNMISILESQPIKQHLYTNNPKMIPDSIKPQCNKMFITVKEPEKPKKKDDSKKKAKVSKNSNTLKNMFDNISSSKKSEEDQTLKTNKTHKSPVKASRGSKKLQTPSKNQMDLRSMFSKINNSQCIGASQVCTQESSENKIEECPVLNKLVTKIKSYINTSIINKSSCKICGILNNKTVCSTTNKQITTKWTKLNLSVLDSITSESLTKFSESITLCKNIKSNKFTTFNESKNSNRTSFNNLSSKTSSENNSLQFFNLESTCEVFSDDDSTEAQEYIIQDPIIFNNSLGIFESSTIYHTPVKTNIYETETLSKTKNSEQIVFETEDFSTETKENKDRFENEDDLIIISDSEGTSPILCTQRFVNYKQKINRKLFSQQNTDNTSKEVDQECQILSDKKAFDAKSDKLSADVSVQPTEKEIVKNIIVSTPKLVHDSNVAKVSEINDNSAGINATPKQDYNMDFWDESLFEICDSDESLFEDENKLITNKNTSPKCIEKQRLFENENKLITNKNTSPKCIEKQTEVTNNKLNNSNENKEDSDNDSDTTIILSFNTDQIFEDIQQESSKFQTVEQLPKQICSNVNNISVCNKTSNIIDSSLLSVTQAIELLNDSKFKLDNSVKITGHKISEIGNKSLQNQTLNNNILKSPAAGANQIHSNNSDSKTITENMDTNKIQINITNATNYTEINKEESNDKNNIEFDDLEISEIFKDFDEESEEEFSLLCFSQKRKRKLQQKKFETGNNAKSARTSTDTENNQNYTTAKNKSTENLLNVKSARIKQKSETSQNYSTTSNKNTENILKTSCNKTILDSKKTDNSCISNVLKDKNSENDFEDQSLFAQEIRKLSNKKFKLTTLKNTKKSFDETINKASTHINPLQLPPKKVAIINNPIILSDSDDDFEVRPAIKPVSKLITPIKKSERVKSVPTYSKSDENTNKCAKSTTNVPKSRSQSYPTKYKKIGSKKKSACAFIDDEAEVEDDEHYESDSDSDRNSDEQLLDSSFVSHTQNIHDQTDMRAKYLQSIRSPKFKPGAFKMPHRPPPQIYDDVFSQVENYENETYVDDSFCVANDQPLTERDSMSFLEILEDKLEKEKNTKKRKRIITISDSD